MQECAQTPGCMFCLPKWVGGGALINYCISGIMIFVCFIIFFKGRKINKTEEEVQE